MIPKTGDLTPPKQGNANETTIQIVQNDNRNCIKRQSQRKLNDDPKQPNHTIKSVKGTNASTETHRKHVKTERQGKP